MDLHDCDRRAAQSDQSSHGAEDDAQETKEAADTAARGALDSVTAQRVTYRW